MAGKCCKSQPPCKHCPKRRKGRKKGIAAVDDLCTPGFPIIRLYASPLR